MDNKFLELLQLLKNLPKPFLCMLIFLPVILSLSILGRIIPSLSLFLRANPIILSTMWIISIASILLLLFDIIALNYLKLKTKRDAIKQHNLDTTNTIQRMLQMTNKAKSLLCNIYENCNQGDTTVYNSNDSDYVLIKELKDNNFLLTRIIKQRELIRNQPTISEYWLSPDIYQLLQKDNHLIFNQLKNSIPTNSNP